MNVGKNEVRKIIEKMDLDRKIGQCLTFGFSGSIVTDDFLEVLERFHCGGLRLSPYSNNFEYKTKPTPPEQLKFDENYIPSKNKKLPVSIAPYLTPGQYAGLLDRFQDIARKNNCGVPLHISVDQEGDLSADIVKGGVALFGSQMGTAATNDPKLARKAAAAIARQLRNYGVNMTHAPVVDVNICYDNMEIDTRAFSDIQEICAEFAAEMMKGYQSRGIIATAKHFPGRGNSNVDSHDDVPVINDSLETFRKRDFIPYKKLIAEGVDAIMLAHTVYPGLDKSGLMATVSPTIVTGILRKELGFKGVITTDSITMAALVKKYGVAKGAALALQAGCDLVLMKEEAASRGEMFYTIKDFIKRGMISEEDLNEKVCRILTMKAKRNLFEKRKSAKIAEKSFPDKQADRLSRKIALKSMIVTKNKDNLVPIGKKRIYLIEQIFFDRSPNDFWNHPRKFYEILMKTGLNIVCRSEMLYQDYAMGGTGKVDFEKATEHLDKKDYDMVLVTSSFYRNYHNDPSLIEDIIKKSQKPVLMITNTPYESGYVKSARNAIINFTTTPPGFMALAEVLSGKKKAEGKLPLSDKIRRKLPF